MHEPLVVTDREQTGLEDRQEDPWRCTAYLCVYIYNDSAPSADLGVSRSTGCDFMSVLSYRRFFLSASCTVGLLLGMPFYCGTVSLLSMRWLCWFSCQYLPSDCLERHL